MYNSYFEFLSWDMDALCAPPPFRCSEPYLGLNLFNPPFSINRVRVIVIHILWVLHPAAAFSHSIRLFEFSIYRFLCSMFSFRLTERWAFSYRIPCRVHLAGQIFNFMQIFLGFRFSPHRFGDGIAVAA